jgi:hypothetical protein
MMRYAIIRSNGSVLVMIPSPVTISANDGSAVYRRERFRGGIPYFRREGVETGGLYSFKIAAHYADWEVDTIINHTIKFAKPEDEIAKWPTADELRAAGADEIEIEKRPRRDDIVSIVSIASVPSRDEFRNAWRCYNGALVCDMPKAAEIWRAKMRTTRESKLDALDRLYSRAIGQGKLDEAEAIEAQRQALRDVTADPAIAAAKTPDELKQVWPAILK